MTVAEQIDALAQEIRRVDGENSLGAGALAEALMPFLAAQHRREAEAGDDVLVRNDDIAAASILYQCADCIVAEADYSCHNRDDVFIIGGKVICRDCADAGHQGEQRRTVPDIAAKLKRQRMAIAHEQRRFAASPSSPASGVRVKALEWVKHPEVAAWRCDSIVGRYQVFAVNPGHASWSMDGQPGVAVGGFVDDADTAKAAAQADYESRILSALGEHP